jgi:prevent-host-death family protein
MVVILSAASPPCPIERNGSAYLDPFLEGPFLDRFFEKEPTAGERLDESSSESSLVNMTQRIAAAGARKHFASLVKQSARGERIKITRYNKTAVVLIPKRDLEALEDCEKESADQKKTG